MVIVSQSFGNAFPPHHQKRSAIRQTPMLVPVCGVEIKRLTEQGASLRLDRDIGVLSETGNRLLDQRAERLPFFAEQVGHFHKYHFRGASPMRAQTARNFLGPGIKVIRRVQQRHPVACVRKTRFIFSPWERRIGNGQDCAPRPTGLSPIHWRESANQARR